MREVSKRDVSGHDVSSEGVLSLSALIFSDVDPEQSATPSPRVAPVKPSETPPPPADGLAEAPLEADGLGLRMRVPVGTSVRVERNPTNYLLSEDGDTPAWRMRIAGLTASKAETTASTQCKEYIEAIRAKGGDVEVLVDEPRNIAGRDAHLIYVAVPLDGGGRGITSNLVVPNGPDAYLVFATIVVESEYARIRPLLASPSRRAGSPVFAA